MSSSLYDEIRQNVETSSTGHEERVEVNQRALIDKILARYASAGAVYRELLQNSNDAEATIAEIYFSTGSTEEQPSVSSKHKNNLVTQVQYRNNGMPFRPQDWSRLKKIAEGNPDETKIGAFGVGAYTMFSICEEPMVLSGNQALAFVWKGDALWTKTIDNTSNSSSSKKNQGWTSFILPSRDPYPLPDLQEFGEFLCASLTFTKCLQEIRLLVNDHVRLTITKTPLQDKPSIVQIQKHSSWWKSDGATTRSPHQILTLQNDQSLLESFYHLQVTLDGDTAALTARYVSASAKTKIPAQMVKRMERVTKKKPPSKVQIEIFLNGQEHFEDSSSSSSNSNNNNHKKKSPARKILQSFTPRLGEGRIFIGFRTSQTTGLAAHLAAPFVPTVEREAMDLQDPTLRMFNLELLEFAGILMRLTLEHGLSSLGVSYAKGTAEREALEEKLRKEEEEKQKQKQKHITIRDGKDKDDDSINTAGMTVSTEAEEPSSNASRMWGFAKYMAKGVKTTIVKVVNKVEEYVDDGGELIHPRDPRPLCSEEHQAILLMQSFCPRQSTPDPTVGYTLAQGFSRCLPEQAPSVLTRTGVVTGDVARLPHKGMEAFCRDNVVRSVVYQNAQEYYDVVAQCQPLNLNDLSQRLKDHVMEEEQLIRFLKWWVRFGKIYSNNISSSKSLEIKERIRFFLNYKSTNQQESIPVFSLSDFLFYLDKDRIPSGNSSFSLDTLPMPDSVLPKLIQDSVGTKNLTDSSLQDWFEPLPIEIWIDFISQHACMNAGQPEDEKLRLQVLSTMSQEYMRLPAHKQVIFGSFCESIMKERRCLPFDSNVPTSYCADYPSNLYLHSAELDAFDGIGNFHKVSQTLKPMGVSDDFLVALGVRKSVAVDFLFSHLDTLKWSNDPKPLVEYLRTATLTPKDMAKLRSTQYLPCENDTSRMFAPNELYLPDRELRLFSFLRLLQWPSSQDEITQRTQNGRFLVSLGMKVNPPLIQLLKYISDQVDDDALRIRCLEFVSKRLGSNSVYKQEYGRIGRADMIKLKLLPCVLLSPLDGIETKGYYSVLTCCSEETCSTMGFPVIDPSLGDAGKILGNVFHCVKEPDGAALLQQLLSLVSTAKQSLRSNKQKAVAEKILQAFTDIFKYLSTRASDMGPSLIRRLEKETFIPSHVDGKIEWFRPNAVFFRSEQGAEDTVTESLFHVVDFSPFLAAAGVKQEASTKDIFRLMIESPQSVLSALKTEEKYRAFLRRVAAHRPFQRVTPEIRRSPFLLSYSSGTDDESKKEASSYELSIAEDIYIIDNSFFGRMFPVKHAPPESDLEEFYALLGSKYISKEVVKNFDVVDATKGKTDLSKALLERIQERRPLLVSPSITSRPLVANASKVLDDKHLAIYQASEIKAVYSLGKSVRSQKTTCCSQRGQSKKQYSLFVTSDFDWFDVGYAIGELILERCQLEDAFFISSLLEAPLEQLRSRGFPVDRIIKPVPLVEPEAPPPKPSKYDQAKSPPSTTIADLSPDPVVGNGDGNGNGTAATASPTSPSGQQTGSPTAPAEKGPTTTDADDYAKALKQMFPEADEELIKQQLGPNPSMQKVQEIAEEMAMSGAATNLQKAPKKDETRSQQRPTPDQESKVASKLLGSKKLGKALNGLLGSSGRNIRQQQPPSGGSINGPATGHSHTNPNTPVAPEADASGHQNMERMLEHMIQASRSVDPNGVQSQEHVHMNIPEGLDKGPTCEVIPGNDLLPCLGVNDKGSTHNGIRAFSARKHPSSYQFLLDHADALESFAVVLERLCRVFGLPLTTVAIFHDPTGGVIAFNLNRALHFNLRFFYALHYSKNAHRSRACYSYWFVTFCHELAHHMASGHNKEHGFYTESYVTLYLPKVMVLMAQLED